MNLARRLLSGSMLVVTVLVLAVVLIAGGRLRARLVADKIGELDRAARLVAAQWTRDADADALAHRAGEMFGYRVTLVDSAGTVLGDGELTADARRGMESQAAYGEISAARRAGSGSARRRDTVAGEEVLYVAVRHPLGFVRVAVATRQLDAIVSGAQRDVVVSGLVALLGVFAVSLLFARSVSQPIVELRDVARAISAGDLSRRPALAAPGEVGDLATALHRMAEQLETRMQDLEADDAFMIAVLESLEEGILAFDASGTVVRLNERARLLLDVTSPLPLPREGLPRDAVLRAALEAAMSGASAPALETTFHERTVAIGARPLPGAGAVITVLDLTMLRRLETIRRDFVANVSHELKTPLTVVRGYAETLLDDSIPPDQRRRFVAIIRDNAGRMQRIVDDLLDLSRIESGGWRPRVGSIDVANEVRAVLAGVQGAAAEGSVALHVEIAADAARLHADPTAFRQILSNLVENAVRYTKRGAVTVRFRREADAIVADVSDTGVGIAAEHLPRIFERFYRVDAGRSREHGGTGLGLAIVRHLVDAHGGRVSATSTPGRGTTITVHFPQPAAGPG